jgi:hypothetical protein
VLLLVSSVARLLYGSRDLYDSYPAALAGLVGQDGITLVVGIPLLLGSTWLARRGSIRGLLLWLVDQAPAQVWHPIGSILTVVEAEMGWMKTSGIAVARVHLRKGRADEEVIVLAEEIGADLIVMGSRGLGGLRRAPMGSVSDSVVRHANCPVLVVRKER